MCRKTIVAQVGCLESPVSGEWELTKAYCENKMLFTTISFFQHFIWNRTYVVVWLTDVSCRSDDDQITGIR